MKMKEAITGVNVRMPQAIHRKVMIQKAARGMSIQDIYKEAIIAWLSKEDTAVGGVITPDVGREKPLEVGVPEGLVGVKEYIQVLKDLGDKILEGQTQLQAQIHALTAELRPPPARKKGKPARAEKQRPPLATGRRAESAPAVGTTND